MTKEATSLVHMGWGDGSTVVVRRDDKTGKLFQVVRGALRLSEARKEAFRVSSDKPVASITTPGAERLNSLAGISVVPVPTIQLPDGTVRGNPHVELDEGGNIRRVHVRRVGIGYNPLGTLCVCDETLMYDVSAYWLIDVIKAISPTRNWGDKPGKPANTALGFFVNLDHLPELDATRWLVIPHRQRIGIALNLHDPSFARLADADAGRVKFAERIAQSICRRNAILHHPAVGTRTVELGADGTGPVTIYGWQQLERGGAAQMREIAERMLAGEESVAFQLIEDRAPRGHKAEAVLQHVTEAHYEVDGDLSGIEELEDGAESGAPIQVQADPAPAQIERMVDISKVQASTLVLRGDPPAPADIELGNLTGTGDPRLFEPPTMTVGTTSTETYRRELVQHIDNLISAVGDEGFVEACGAISVAPETWRRLGLGKLRDLAALLAQITATGLISSEEEEAHA